MRAKWKNNFDFFVNKNCFVNDVIKNPSTMVTADMVGSRVSIYNGREIFSLLIREYMVGTRYGYYPLYKKTGDFHPEYIKKKRRKKKRKGKLFNKKRNKNKNKNKKMKNRRKNRRK